MRAMVLRQARQPLEVEERAVPEPAADQVLVKVHACGVCRTDLHVVDGELAKPKLPLVPGHEVVGEVAAVGAAVEGLQRTSGSAFHGSASPAASVRTAGPGARTCAIARASPATISTAVTPSMRS